MDVRGSYPFPDRMKRSRSGLRLSLVDIAEGSLSSEGKPCINNVWCQIARVDRSTIGIRMMDGKVDEGLGDCSLYVRRQLSSFSCLNLLSLYTDLVRQTARMHTPGGSDYACDNLSNSTSSTRFQHG